VLALLLIGILHHLSENPNIVLNVSNLNKEIKSKVLKLKIHSQCNYFQNTRDSVKQGFLSSLKQKSS
jgi:hypothetical protein